MHRPVQSKKEWKTMIREGLKLTYSMGRIDGVRESIKFEVGDIVWKYDISESYRNLHPNEHFERTKCRVIEASPSIDGKHFEAYGLQNLKTKAKGYWYYPTFLEPTNEL